MAEFETPVFPHPAELTPGSPNLLVTPDQVLYFYNQRGVRGETSIYVNGLVRGWFASQAKARGWASVTWLGDSSCESPGAGCWLSILHEPKLPEPRPTETKPKNEVEEALAVALEYAGAMTLLEKVSRKLKPGWKFQPISLRELAKGDAMALVGPDGQALMIMYKHNYDSILAEPPPKDEEYA